MLDKTQITSLKCASHLAQFLTFALFLGMASRQQHLTRCDSLMRSVDGHALPIDELKGTKPTETIDLSCKPFAKKLHAASGLIIGACIKENVVLKELKCAARPLHARQRHSL